MSSEPLQGDVSAAHSARAPMSTIFGDDRILVIAPHQDDESIGCGGAIAKWSNEGACVGILWVSADDSGAAIGPEARAAARVLHARWTHGIGLPQIGVADDSDTLAAFVSGIRHFRPTVLLLPHEGEDDRQHSIVSRIAVEAEWVAAYPTLPQAGPSVQRCRLVLGYEVWTPISRPRLIVDIAATAETKSRAIACYSSQTSICDFPAAAMGLARYRGEMSAVGTYAEAYDVVRWRETLVFPTDAR